MEFAVEQERRRTEQLLEQERRGVEQELRRIEEQRNGMEEERARMGRLAVSALIPFFLLSSRTPHQSFLRALPLMLLVLIPDNIGPT